VGTLLLPFAGARGAAARKILEPPTSVTLDYSDNTLILQGAADHQWISSFRQKAGSIPGVVSVDEENLADTSVSALTLARKNLESLRLFFPLGEAVLKDGQNSVLQKVIETILEIQALQNILNAPVKIVIIGNTDPSGSELLNLQLSRQRADTVFSLLIKKGIHAEYISSAGPSEIGRDNIQSPGTDHALNRNVMFITSMFEIQRDRR